MADAPAFLEFRATGMRLWLPVVLSFGGTGAAGVLLSLAESTLLPLAFTLGLGFLSSAVVFPLAYRMFVRVDDEGVVFRTFRRRHVPWSEIAGLAETSYAQSTRRIRCPALRLRDGTMPRLPFPHSDFPTYEADLAGLRAFFVARLGARADLPPGKYSLSEAPPERSAP
ncbi:hypothetical protein GCM10022221_71890 [Actinocorallia aurea]